MPESYTHAHIAQQALMRSGKVVASYPAFLAGANGPNPLYAYKMFKKDRKPDLPALAKRMHMEKTGAFLATLIQLAMTAEQQSYALGFLCHYAADCVLHPYVTAMSEKGKPYDMKMGSSFMQASIDSTLYYQDYKTYTVPYRAGVAVIITNELAQVISLLHDSIRQVYDMDIPIVDLADTFHQHLALHKRLVAPSWAEKTRMAMQEKNAFGKDGEFKLRSRIQPAKPLKKLPSKWYHPYTHEEMDVTLDELLVLAEQASAACIMATMDFWVGNIDIDKLVEVVGDNNYYTGLPNAAKAGQAVLQEGLE